MTKFADVTDYIVTRGHSILSDIAGTYEFGYDKAEADMLSVLRETCKTPTDIACVIAALADWDAEAVRSRLTEIAALAETYAVEWREERQGEDGE